MMVEKVTITEADLHNPPPGSAITKTPGNIIEQVKAGIAQFKEVIKLAESVGIDLPGKLKELTQGKGQPPGDAPGAAPGVGQANAFLQLLIVKYGDITVNELVEKLRADLGDKKLSNITGKE